jgi:acyl transferase domain-containing protein
MARLDQQDIAIVGMAGLFSQAPDVASYWSNILSKVCAIGEPLPDWGADLFYDPQSDDLTRIYTKHGGFLKELSRFDPRPHGIMPISVYGSEPDQFHALDLAKAALQDAGYDSDDYDGESTGVILGHGIHAHRANTNGIQIGLVVDQTIGMLHELFPHVGPAELERIKTLLKSKLPTIDVDVAPGLVPNVMSGRIANRLNLMGPNYLVDAACAASLIAVESAMLELQRGRADIMLAGGINTTTSPLVYAVFCALGALSRSSDIRPFDAGADGTLLGEGGGVVVLKRLADAQRDGDRIYAVLKGVGQSSDGKAKGLMAPRMQGEALAIRRAYEQTGIAPDSIGLVEAHGTGIPLGDRTEIQALQTVFGERRRQVPDIALGSVKSMIGHTIPAAGIASLIKMTLSLHHKVLPPTLCSEVSPQLGIENTPFYINTEARPWVHGGSTPRRAGINAFGFGGVNSHAILEEAPDDDADKPFSAFIPKGLRSASELFVLSAGDRPALLQGVAALRQRLGEDDGPPFSGLAKACWEGLGEGRQRLAIIASNQSDLDKKLALVEKKLADSANHQIQARTGVYFTDRPLDGRIAFLFPGENSQYTDMLARLALHFPAVRGWFDFLDSLFAEQRDIRPSEAIFPPPTCLSAEDQQLLKSRLQSMDLGSEAAFVADQGLNALLRGFGIKPGAALGHSTGENAALVASDVLKLSKREVGEYIEKMNALYQQLEASGSIPPGVLLTVGASSLKDVQEVLDADPELHLTMDNCNNQFILFGNEAGVKRAEQTLKSKGAICSQLPFGRGYHTPLLAPMASAFRSLFEDVELKVSDITLYSCVKAEPFPEEAEAIRDTAADQYMTRVRFRESIQRLHEDGVRLFVECGPSSHLTAFVRDILGDRPHLAVAVNDRNRDDLQTLLHLLGRLFVHGTALDLAPLYQDAEDYLHDNQAPYLPTSLARIELEPEEAADLRALFVGDQAAVPAPAADQAQRHAPSAAKADAPAPAGRKPRRSVTDHFNMMNEFLQQQERVMTTWYAKRRKPGQ